MLIIICLCKNNLRIGNIVCNLELLPCIVKRHFELILHLHIYVNLGHFAYIMFFFKNETYLSIICKCMYLSFTFYKTKKNVFFHFFNFNLLSHTLKMKPNFLDEGCDVFMNENEIKMKGKTKIERF